MAKSMEPEEAVRWITLTSQICETDESVQIPRSVMRGLVGATPEVWAKANYSPNQADEIAGRLLHEHLDALIKHSGINWFSADRNTEA